MANRCIDKVSIDVNAFCGLLKRNNMYVTGKNGLDLVLDREAKTIRRWLKAGEIPVSMVDDICNALKCKKEEFIMEIDKKWYGFESYAEGGCLEAMQLTKEEFAVVKKAFCTREIIYDEGYSGIFSLFGSEDGYDSKLDLMRAYAKEASFLHIEDIIDDDMAAIIGKEQDEELKDTFTLEEMMDMYRNSIACKMMESIRKDCEEE